MKFKVSLTIQPLLIKTFDRNDVGRKISAIKAIRNSTGLGLYEAKEFVEKHEGKTTELILNQWQLLVLQRETCSTGTGTLSIVNVESIPELPALDLSHLHPHAENMTMRSS